MQHQIALMNKDGKIHMVFKFPTQNIELDLPSALNLAQALIFNVTNVIRAGNKLIEVPRIIPPSDVKGN